MKILHHAMIIFLVGPAGAVRSMEVDNNSSNAMKPQEILPLYVLAFRRVTAEAARDLYAIQQLTTSEERLHGLAKVDQKFLKLPPSLQRKVFKQALLLFESVNCANQGLINDLWYAHMDQLCYTMFYSICRGHNYPDITRYTTNANNKLIKDKYTQENVYKILSTEKRKLINNIKSEGLNLCYNETFFSELENNDALFVNEVVSTKFLNNIKFYCDTLHRNTEALRKKINEYFKDKSLSPRMSNLYERLNNICSPSVYDQIFLIQYSNNLRKAVNVKEFYNEIIDLISDPLFDTLSCVMQKFLALHLYKNRIKSAEVSVFDRLSWLIYKDTNPLVYENLTKFDDRIQQQQQTIIAAIKKYYNDFYQESKQTLEDITIQKIIRQAMQDELALQDELNAKTVPIVQ